MSGARMTKADALARWRALEPSAPIAPQVIPYKARGSTYGLDGVRIEGSPAFIDGILSRLKPLLELESGDTRIALNYQAVEPRPGKACAGDHVCYIKFHERGPEARIANAFAARICRRGKAAAGAAR